MKARLFDIKRFAIHDGPGVRSSVFFKDCPLRCAWCHNPEAISNAESITEESIVMDGMAHQYMRRTEFEMSTAEIMSELARDSELYRISAGEVTFTGGEPLMQFEVVKELLSLCRQQGFHTVLDTCGEIDANRFLEACMNCDLVLIDIKHIDAEEHRKYTGRSNARILDNLVSLSHHGVDARIRYPFVPGVNTSSEYLAVFADFLSRKSISYPIDLLPYHQLAKHKYERLPPSSWHEFSLPQKEEIYFALDYLNSKGFTATMDAAY